MGDIVIGVAAYRNSENAVGYSFRWYVTALFSSPDIRLLAIDGVEPTVENIRSGAYPFTVPMLAVTARPLSAESKSLLDWITGPEGQDLLERVGYVPLR
jgi:phosphate transport system substrate-binding protein